MIKYIDKEVNPCDICKINLKINECQIDHNNNIITF